MMMMMMLLRMVILMMVLLTHDHHLKGQFSMCFLMGGVGDLEKILKTPFAAHVTIESMQLTVSDCLVSMNVCLAIWIGNFHVIYTR